MMQCPWAEVDEGNHLRLIKTFCKNAWLSQAVVEENEAIWISLQPLLMAFADTRQLSLALYA